MAATEKNASAPGLLQTMRRNSLTYKNKGKKGVWSVVRFILLLGLSFIIVFPFFAQVCSSFMTGDDLLDQTVKYFSRNPTLENYKFVIQYTDYFQLMLNTVILCVVCAVLQTFFCAWIGYGFARSKSRFIQFLFSFVILTIMIPPQLIRIPLFMFFRYPDIWGILQALTGKALPFNTIDTLVPMIILSVTGLGLRCGLFIFMMRQFYRGLPHELLEAACVDGAGVYRTYFQIVFPLGKNLMLTIFILVVAWQWTDGFYSTLFFPNFKMLPSILSRVTVVNDLNALEGTLASGLLLNTATVLILLPLIVIYILAQKQMVEGIERSGIVG